MKFVEWIKTQWQRLMTKLPGHWIVKVTGVSLVGYLFLVIVLGIYWSAEPDLFNVQNTSIEKAELKGHDRVVGYATVSTLHTIGTTLLEKQGGYLSNDITPPGIWLDNMPSWEFGVVTQMRDLSRALRKDMSRSQSQSTEDPDLAIAEPQFHFDNSSWAFPATESEYRRGLNYLERYLDRLADQDNSKAQFFARADNLNTWLMDVETRLGSLSQRLSASVGQIRENTDLSGDPAAQQSTSTVSREEVKTSWWDIDDVFFEARGTAWALSHMLRAVAIDFDSVLEKKNATASLNQIIRELEATQQNIWSPMILNGSGFGMLANHSLVMANYISRANAAIIDLRDLLQNG